MTNDQAAKIINEAAARANRNYSVARAKADSEWIENLRAYSQRQHEIGEADNDREQDIMEL